MLPIFLRTGLNNSEIRYNSLCFLLTWGAYAPAHLVCPRPTGKRHLGKTNHRSIKKSTDLPSARFPNVICAHIDRTWLDPTHEKVEKRYNLTSMLLRALTRSGQALQAARRGSSGRPAP